VSTAFKPLEIPPGVVAKPTKQMRSSNWSEVNLVRWREGQMAPVGGQAQYNYSFASRCKLIHGWYGLDSVYHIAYLCETNLYVDTGGGLTDITPAGGLTPPAPYGVGGYSDGNYNDGTYGTPRPLPTVIAMDKVPDAWSLDNFGAILLAMTSPDGRLLQWDPAAGGLATIVAGAPHGRCFAVTQERFVQIFACTQDGTTDGGSFRRFAWCDQENFSKWDFSNVASQAGFLDIEPSSPIVACEPTRTGTLFWTGKKAYVSRFLGMPFIYNYAELADACTPWSPASVASTSSTALWMSEQGMFSFDGTSILPVACLVRPWVDDDIDLLQVREQACAVHVGDFNEFWWFFPQNGKTTNTRAIIYNYKEGWWSQARMSRSAGVTSAYNAHTIMADGTIAFEHEASVVYGNADLPWAETYDLNIVSGGRLTTVKQMIPDIGGNVQSLLYSLFYRSSRSLGTPELQTAPKPVRTDGFVDFRTTGRDIRLRIQVNPAYGGVLPVTVGQHLIDAVPRGDR
jgi:hypothetical protein